MYTFMYMHIPRRQSGSISLSPAPPPPKEEWRARGRALVLRRRRVGSGHSCRCGWHSASFCSTGAPGAKVLAAPFGRGGASPLGLVDYRSRGVQCYSSIQTKRVRSERVHMREMHMSIVAPSQHVTNTGGQIERHLN